MARSRGRKPPLNPGSEAKIARSSPLMKSEAMDQDPVDYEKYREERIKSNMERMKQLGLLNLSRDVNSAFTTPNSSAKPKRRVFMLTDGSKKKVDLTPPLPSRRSSRLQNVAPINYKEVHGKKTHDSAESDVVLIEEGGREEWYTEEHEKLLGSREAPWTLFEDGYDKDGKRIYDPAKGKTCHQCRQKTMGYRTSCCKCKLVQGQFCGDCLYMRYGENVLEAIKNPDWICPACRGICNCSFCRLKKGWKPTGTLYRRVVKLGYKSVAHYLIQTHQKPANSGQATSEITTAMSDSTEAGKENEPKPETISEETDERIIVVSTNESSAINDGETMGKRRRVSREKGKGHSGAGESSATNDRETMGKRRQVNREKGEGHSGTSECGAINNGETMGKRCQVTRRKGVGCASNISPGPIAARLRRRLYGI